MTTTAPFSYLDMPTAAPLSITELMPGAYNLLEYAAVTAGEQVLILAEHGTDPVVIQAIGAAAAYRSAEVHVLSTQPFSAGGWDRESPSPLLSAAHAAADVVLSLTWWGEVHTARLFFEEVAKQRARFVSLHQTATASALSTGARFPLALYLALEARAYALISAADEIRVTTALGTDVTFRDFTTGTPVTGHSSAPVTSGMWRPFPYGGANFSPDRTDGVVVIEESTVTGVPTGRTTLELENNRVTAIHGGAATQLHRYGPDGYYLRHALIGLNPKVRAAGGTQFEREKHAGAFYLGIDGVTAQGAVDRSRPGHAHCDCQFDQPTITLDGQPFVDNGHLLLLDDPEIRELAEKFGPADILLNPNPRLVLPARYSR
jgi:2,5-dihydroxypyridine 5,6-dioxygenase